MNSPPSSLLRSSAAANQAIGHRHSTANSQTELRVLEQAYCVVTWLFFTSGLDTIFGDVAIISTLLRYLIFAIALFFLCARGRRSLHAASKGGALWVVMALSVASIAWSMSPADTIDSVRGEVLPMTAFALYYASRFNIREQMRIVCVALMIAAVLSLFYAVAIPSIGTHVGGEFDGAWRGLYSQKNVFSSTMTITMLLFYILSIVNNDRKERLVARVCLGFSVAMILLSTSKSALVIFIVLLFAVALARLFRWRGRRSVLLLDLGGLIGLGGLAVFSVTWQAMAIALGKDPTLSARTYIWSGSLEKIVAQPILGYGRAAFWTEGSRPAFEVGALASKGFVPSHAHNGYLDVGLDIGLVGLGVFFIGLIATFGIALRRAYRASEPEDLWPLAFLILLVIYNVTESLLLQRITIYWVMYMTVFLSLRIWPRRTGQSVPEQPAPL